MSLLDYSLETLSDDLGIALRKLGLRLVGQASDQMDGVAFLWEGKYWMNSATFICFVLCTNLNVFYVGHLVRRESCPSYAYI